MSTTSSKKTSSTAPKTARKAAQPKPKLPIQKVPPSAGVLEKTATQSSITKSNASKLGLTGPVMKKQELIEKVVRLSGAKKKDAKPVVEAMLEVLGDALADGRELNLQPMGKVKMNRTKETPNARIIIAKIRQSKGMHKLSNPTVAAAAE